MVSAQEASNGRKYQAQDHTHMYMQTRVTAERALQISKEWSFQ